MLSVVIVAYRTPSLVAATVASLRAQELMPDEIIAIDNGAPEGAPLHSLDGVRIERAPANVGFGAGCNVGAKLARGDELLFMNGDVVLTHDAIAALSRRLHADPKTAVVGPRIFAGGQVQLSARTWPSIRTGLLGRRSRLTRLLLRAGRYPAELRPASGRAGEVDWVSGACMLVRRLAFEEVDGFDEGFWMYWEDADLCRRLAHRSWTVMFEPAAVVHHATGASGTSERTIRAFHDSARRFAERYLVRSEFDRRFIATLLAIRNWVVLWSFARRRTRLT